jgi:hypothetical protein
MSRSRRWWTASGMEGTLWVAAPDHGYLFADDWE